MKWGEFKKAATEIAKSAETLLDKTGVLILGSLRKDGSPRVSPVEFVFVDGDLQLGMMPRSFKVLDLRRDPRCSIHTTVTDRMSTDGEFKAHGRAVDIQDPKIRKRYCEALYEKIGWNPEGMDFGLFSIELETAASSERSSSSNSETSAPKNTSRQGPLVVPASEQILTIGAGAIRRGYGSSSNHDPISVPFGPDVKAGSTLDRMGHHRHVFANHVHLKVGGLVLGVRIVGPWSSDRLSLAGDAASVYGKHVICIDGLECCLIRRRPRHAPLLVERDELVLRVAAGSHQGNPGDECH